MRVKKIFSVLLAVVLLFSVSICTSAFAATYKEVYSPQIYSCSFLWAPDDQFAVYMLKAFTNNTTYGYYEESNGKDNAYRIRVFAKADDQPPDSYAVESVYVSNAQINNTTWLGLTYDPNVLVDPNWVWDFRYIQGGSLTGSFPAGTPYQVRGVALLRLSNDCSPNLFSPTNTIYMQ